MWPVHFRANKIGTSHYGLFIALLTAVMLVPAIPLQMVFAHQAARAHATGTEHELAGLVRFICFATLGLWAIVCLAVLLLQGKILSFWGITDPIALWITMPILLITIWAPVFMGMLQGEQNFFWLGWSMLSGGVGRLAAAAVAVIGVYPGATCVVLGGLGRAVPGLFLGIWETPRSLRLAPRGLVL